MKEFVKLSMICILLLSSLVFSHEKEQIKADVDPTIIQDGKEYLIKHSNDNANFQNNREEIILWEENFENGENGWSLGSGWEITSQSSNSESHSALSPDSEANMNSTHNLLTPVLSLDAIGQGETLNFGFWLWDDQPGSSQVDDPSTTEDESQYLADYYSISVLDLAALAWHSSEENGSAIGGSGANFWCADEEDVGGYLDSWIQYMDTPSISVGSGGNFSARLYFTIESPAGAVVSGSCTDGWDAANIRISSDGGATWDLLEDNNNPYDFDCGYGWIWNDTEYDTGGSLNHLAAGWGGNRSWHDFNADLSAYAGQDVIIRFAFGSDPAYSTIDDSSITGFQVDEILIEDSSGTLYSNDGSDEATVSVSGEVWVDQFYDYGSCADERPGCDGWEEYLPGMAFNGNVFMDISDFAGKDVVFRIQSRYDDTQETGMGQGLFIDDFKIYKISGGNYPTPNDLAVEAGDGEAMLSWADMNSSGTSDFIFDNDNVTNSIQMSTEGSTAFAGERIDLAGSSTVNSLSIYNVNAAGTTVTIAGFGALGTLITNEPTYSQDVVLSNTGWNTIEVDGWNFENGYIVGHQFSYDVLVGLDESAVPSSNSMVLFSGGAWDAWSVAGASVGDGEWGIRANISYEGANVTYNVYRDGSMVVSGLTENSHTDTGLTNNTTYEYTISATYSDGEESEESDAVEVTPFADTVHEESHDDGSFESEFIAGSGNFSAVRYSAGSSGEDIVRFKWFQNGSGGAFYIKVFEDDGGMPGAETFSSVQASGNTDGWNEKDLSSQGLSVSGDFWIGTKEFSSSKPFGLDTSSDSGNSYSRVGSSGDWTAVSGNLAYHVFLDCGDNCDDEGCANDPGDVNEDGSISILDIIQVANHVLGSTLSGCALEGADVNGDGSISILDIIGIVNIILGNRGIDATSAIIEKTESSLLINADGYVGGVQITLNHSQDFSIKLTEDALFAKSVTEGNKTTMVIVVPETDQMFTYSGDFEIVDIIVANSYQEISLDMPKEFGLSSAYPNPFNPTTSISLNMANEGHVDVKVFDLSGRVVATLLSGNFSAGHYDMKWNASNQASGMYLIRAEMAGNVAMQKILLLK